MSNNPFTDSPVHNPYQSPGFAPPGQMPGQPMIGAYPLATRFQRWLGAFIDNLILGVVGFGIGIGLGLGLLAIGFEPGSIAFQAAATLIGAVLNAGVFLAVNGYLLSTQGQTVGKLLLKTRIVGLNGQPVPFGDLILKRYLPLWVVGAVPIVGGLFLLINALMIFRENRHCFHDDIAGTNVIQLPS